MFQWLFYVWIKRLNPDIVVSRDEDKHFFLKPRHFSFTQLNFCPNKIQLQRRSKQEKEEEKKNIVIWKCLNSSILFHMYSSRMLASYNGTFVRIFWHNSK